LVFIQLDTAGRPVAVRINTGHQPAEGDGFYAEDGSRAKPEQVSYVLGHAFGIPWRADRWNTFS
jgi:hypothetical protein